MMEEEILEETEETEDTPTEDEHTIDDLYEKMEEIIELLTKNL